MSPRRHERQVRYVSPFGSPAWMTREKAERLLAEDLERYDRNYELGVLSDAQRAVGSPRIEVTP